MSRFFNIKVFVADNIIEIYKYNKIQLAEYEKIDLPFFDSIKKKSEDDLKSVDEIFMEEELKHLSNRHKAIIRARNKVRRLCNANSKYFKSFITLTYADNVTGFEDSYKRFLLFLKRVKRYVDSSFNLDFKYLAVLEFTKAGRIHYHLLTNIPLSYKSGLDDPKSKEQKQYENFFAKNIWKNGFVDIRSLDKDEVDNVGAYLLKYMTKDFIMENDRFCNQQIYRYSRNLDKPLELIFKGELEDIKKELAHRFGFDPEKEECYYSKFSNQFTGGVEYREFNLNRE